MKLRIKNSDIHLSGLSDNFVVNVSYIHQLDNIDLKVPRQDSINDIKIHVRALKIYNRNL